MEHIDAVYRHGVFEPEGEVALREDQRVRLSIEPIPLSDFAACLERAGALRARIFERTGFLPDSSPRRSPRTGPIVSDMVVDVANR